MESHHESGRYVTENDTNWARLGQIKLEITNILSLRNVTTSITPKKRT